MGNNHSREGSPKHGISRNNSGPDLQDKVPSQLLPIDKLAKVRHSFLKHYFIYSGIGSSILSSG